LRAAPPPAVGEAARDFTLRTLDDRPVQLRALQAEGPVALVVLRGWPGYQCPLCDRQVNDFIAQAEAFAARKVPLVLVYPGPAEQLAARAQEFLSNRQWPAHFLFVVDPDYAFTNAYGLRWEAAKETAYPSAFVIDRGGVIRFSRISKTHGGRVTAAQLLAELDKVGTPAR
jgi:peroxiredoxin